MLTMASEEMWANAQSKAIPRSGRICAARGHWRNLPYLKDLGPVRFAEATSSGCNNAYFRL
jgi:hypothetical protein